MQKHIIILTSITYVNKAKYLLSENNIKSYIVKMRTTFERRGCGYGLSVSENCLSNAFSILEKYRIKIVEVVEDID
ncbi:MAG: DUF3343 domain-containing protein [Oscillospiraceae bacterium]|nr:DUF3343 domain-containing protein [Oscillospiraceae bacterium]